MSEPDAAQEAMRAEAARQVIALIGGVVLVLAAAWAERKAREPDAWRTWRMRLAKAGERAAATAAARLWRQAERARRAYESEQP